VTVRVLIVDDEAPARRTLRSYLAGEAAVEIVGEAGSGPEAVEAIRAQRPDVVLLDVQMPGMNGFQVLEALGSECLAAVVFVTAYDEFAVEAFEVAAVDYLLKPFTRARFHKALTRAIAAAGPGDVHRESLARVLQAVLARDRRTVGRLLVREGERMFFVPSSAIVRLSAEGNYVRVQTTSGWHEVRETLARLESRFDPEQFVRVHRSEILNLSFVVEIQKLFHGDLMVVLKNGDNVRVSRRYADRLLAPGGRP
jgi:two-component system, LytTR family, response regulator